MLTMLVIVMIVSVVVVRHGGGTWRKPHPL